MRSSPVLRHSLLSQPTLWVTVASVMGLRAIGGLAMARGYGSSGSYRDWERAQRAEEKAKEQAKRRKEQERKTREREQEQREATARDAEAVAKTRAIDQRVEELETVLRSSLSRNPRIELASLRRPAFVPPLDLGTLGTPMPPPDWADFEPEPPRGLGRIFGGQQRHEVAVQDAERMFTHAPLSRTCSLRWASTPNSSEPAETAVSTVSPTIPTRSPVGNSSSRPSSTRRPSNRPTCAISGEPSSTKAPPKAS